MFKLARTHRFWRTVTVLIPDPAKIDEMLEAKFQVEFEAIPGGEAVERLRQISAENPSLREEEIIALAVAERVQDWRDIVGEDGEQVPFSREALAEALKQGWTRNAVWDAYRDAISGRKAELGN